MRSADGGKHRERVAVAHARHRAEREIGGAALALRWWEPVAGALAIAAACTLAWVGAYFATSWLYARVGAHPPELWRQVLTAFLGLFLLAVPAAILGAMHRPSEIAAFRSILSAIRRIAGGDFRVRLDSPTPKGSHPYSQLVSSINDMAAELDRMEAMRQEFVSNVSHEIQSPLTSIKGFAHALKDQRMAPEERLRSIDIIAAEADRLSRLSDNLLRLTALPTEDALRPRTFRLDQQIRRMILSLEPQWAAKGHQVGAELAALDVRADEALLDHVWSNLVHNAIKFTPDGGTIEVSLRSADDGLEVLVRDSGIGIAPADQDHIFERFFKADRSRDRAADGSGLGLALVREIVALHGGEVSVSSAPGSGSVFRVVLPQAPRE